MGKVKDISSNSGTEAQNGFALQRNIALYLILEDYDNKFKDKNYFVSLEHYDDFLFCFMDEKDIVGFIDTYQSKKNDSSNWTIPSLCGEGNSNEKSVLKKIIEVIGNIKTDSIKKKEDFDYALNFISNAKIKLSSGTKGSTVTRTIDEKNSKADFFNLDSVIQDDIKKRIGDSEELKYLYFVYIDFPKTDKAQREQLQGKLKNLFGNQIIDTKAGIDTVLRLFQEVELSYNQGNIPTLLDESKRVTGKEIDDAFNIITSKSKAFDYWRSQTSIIVNKLKIRPTERDTFESNFKSAFDFFKSIEEAEHRKILNFIKSNWDSCDSYSDEDIIEELYNKFKTKEITNFEELELKAIIYAGFFEVTNHKEVN